MTAAINFYHEFKFTAKEINNKIKVFNAVSGQFYENSKNNIYNEKSYIAPQSPYGVSKASSFWLTKIFREWYGIKCCSGILFNHESPLRSNEFVTKKIVNHCKLIKKGKYSIHSKKYISVKKSINEDIPFSDIEITYSDSKPQVVIFGNHKNKYKFLASLTHDAGVAVGVVISKKLS